MTYGVGLPPPVGAGEPASGRGDNHTNNVTQKARTLLREDADPAFCDAYFPGSCMLRQHPAGRRACCFD